MESFACDNFRMRKRSPLRASASIDSGHRKASRVGTPGGPRHPRFRPAPMPTAGTSPLPRQNTADRAVDLVATVTAEVLKENSLPKFPFAVGVLNTFAQAYVLGAAPHYFWLYIVVQFPILLSMLLPRWWVQKRMLYFAVSPRSPPCPRPPLTLLGPDDGDAAGRSSAGWSTAAAGCSWGWRPAAWCSASRCSPRPSGA
eukprot:COSAG04_NODE_10153_length_800_cov_1.425107_1_plen_198_part_01